jgi:predicted phosphodiesterase
LSLQRSQEKSRKILSLSDIHFPFQNEAAIEEALEAHSDADILILNGDILDIYGGSSFAKDKVRTIMEEYKLAMDFLIRVSKMFGEVYLVEGNHERRIDTFFSKKLDPHMYALVDHDLLDKLAKGYILDRDGKHVGTYEFDNVFYNDPDRGYYDTWQLVVGKTVFIHPNGYSSQEMKTIVSAQEHADNFYGLDSYDSIVMGHTHDCGKMIRRGKLLIEQGCLSQVMDYNKKGRMAKRPNSVGYAVIYQDEQGNTDFNKSGYVYLGTLNYAAKRKK